ncbi:XRE family transcriptional regulator [Fulvitalea axinellae]|uniref:XRE family transcriptional regulator n=1 Tax=Fulvitalea axinellae TaxID=1182444 RepID=A0AAU9CLG1_9BACT|nr:XRE family transcriptional regulator [Fulvitalea axinellae]
MAFVSDIEKRERYYKAVKERDTSFIGSFFLGVKTTGIFCIPSCRARTPKFANVVFSHDSKELLAHGFRPCKICKPTNHAYEPPEEVQKALAIMMANPYEKVTDATLRAEGIAPEKIRRWFKKHHGMTFQAYQRMTRINMAFQELKKGGKVTDTAFNSGYGSLSGFGYAFKNLLGKSPKEGELQNVVLASRLTTPLGPMFVFATDKGICLLEFTDRKMLETELAEVQKRYGAVILSGENEHIKQAKKELGEYFEGKRKRFAVALDLSPTPSQKEAWDRLLSVGFGQTRTYASMAEEAGPETSVSDIIRANGQNRVAIIVPCHRLLEEDGALAGYGGGLQRKRWLLDHEKANNID